MQINRDLLFDIYTSLAFSNNGKNNPGLISLGLEIEQINFKIILDNLHESAEKFFYLDQPSLGQTILAFSKLVDIKTRGLDLNSEMNKNLGPYRDNFRSNYEDIGICHVPFAVGGLKFSHDSGNTIWEDFENSDWFVPEFLLLKRDGQFFIIFNFLENNGAIEIDNNIKKLSKYSGDSDNRTKNSEQSIFVEKISDKNDYAGWSEKMEYVLSKIAENQFEKVVISRRVDLKFSNEPSLGKVLGELAVNYPDCYIFAFGSGNSVFFGASPEMLVRIKNKELETDALAGSIPRGKTEAEDEILALELLGSQKNIIEQNAVLKFITAQLRQFCSQINYPDNPVIKKLSNIQHLWTPVKAVLNESYTVFDILNALHPTPAVCGVPQKPARNLIREIEGYNRGFYAGIIGWFNFENEAEFIVGIRSALLKNKMLHAYAGCGIVAGSDSLSEYHEAELKLKPILSIFENENIYQP